MEVIDLDSNSGDNSFLVDLDDLEKSHGEEKFKLLSEMFPDAETMFLEAKCAEFALDNIQFDLFLENTMLRGSYPKKVENPPPEQQPQEPMGESFTVLEFLKKYPDPRNHFSNLRGGVDYIQHSCHFLLNSYRLISAPVVRMELNRFNFNLFLTNAELATLAPSRKIARRPTELVPPPGKPPREFADTVFYIKHQPIIDQFFADKVLAHANAVEEARAANALLTCGCCFSDEFLVEEVSTCSEGHIFCKSCILRSSEVQMGSGKLDFPCLEECTGSFPLETLKKIMPPNAFDKLEKKLQERDIATANIPGLETCAFCEYAAIPPEDSRIFDCENCKKQMCRLCRKESHIPLRCEEFEEKNELTKDRLYVEETMTEALLRTCWKCKVKFIREDGCNKMLCSCGAMMCYICRQPVKSYKHFTQDYDSKSIPDKESKCPLWTNNERLHRIEVNREGKKAIEQVKRNNPELENLLLNKKAKR